MQVLKALSQHGGGSLARIAATVVGESQPPAYFHTRATGQVGCGHIQPHKADKGRAALDGYGPQTPALRVHLFLNARGKVVAFPPTEGGGEIAHDLWVGV